jgi:hypothetical protein
MLVLEERLPMDSAGNLNSTTRGGSGGVLKLLFMRGW